MAVGGIGDPRLHNETVRSVTSSQMLACHEKNQMIKQSTDAKMFLCFGQHVGTKNLIRKHQTVLTRLLWEVANAPEDVLPLEKRLEFFTVSYVMYAQLNTRVARARHQSM